LATTGRESIKTESDVNAPDGAHYHWAWKSQNDWTGFVRLGYQFNPNWRAEVEGGYRPGDLTASTASRSSAADRPLHPGRDPHLVRPTCGRRTARSTPGA
jgi:OOP family OmpA-OmpF porin